MVDSVVEESGPNVVGGLFQRDEGGNGCRFQTRVIQSIQDNVVVVYYNDETRIVLNRGVESQFRF